MSENINLEELVELFRKVNSIVDELGFNSHSKSFIQPSKYELFCSFIQETLNKLKGRNSLRSFLSHFRYRLLDGIVHMLHGLSFSVFKGLWTFERCLFRLRLFIYKFTWKLRDKTSFFYKALFFLIHKLIKFFIHEGKKVFEILNSIKNHGINKIKILNNCLFCYIKILYQNIL